MSKYERPHIKFGASIRMPYQIMNEKGEHVSEGIYFTLNLEDGEPDEIFCQLGKAGSEMNCVLYMTGKLLSKLFRCRRKFQDIITRIESLNASLIHDGVSCDLTDLYEDLYYFIDRLSLERFAKMFQNMDSGKSVFWEGGQPIKSIPDALSKGLLKLKERLEDEDGNKNL